MDNLRTAINLLFRHRNTEDIIRSLSNKDISKRADTYVDEEWFIRFFREEANIYSMDQINSIHRIVVGGWMLPPKENGVLSKSKKNIFNVLLHFNKELLLEKESVPVCKYEHLLKWHFLSVKIGEDLLTTSYLAAKDLAEKIKPRTQFLWPAIIGHDNAAINHILQKGLVDLHFHLKGSSYNFDLNWMSLMNSITGRSKEFLALKNYQAASVQFNDTGFSDSLYLMTIKACAIRYLLFKKLEDRITYDNKEIEQLSKLLFSNTLSEALMDASLLERKLQTLGYLQGKKYGGKIIDYAIKDKNSYHEKNDNWKYLMNILSGERELMYRMFCEIYRGREDFEFFTTLFYAYLSAKNRIRQELVQLNEKIGFGNFAHYEGRKELFIRENSIYATLIPNMAVNGFVKDDNKNGLEARITPKPNGDALAKAIIKTDANIYDKSLYPTSKSPLQVYIDKESTNVKDFHYILHFIKKGDKIKKRRDLFARQHKLLKDTAKEAKAIHYVRKHYPKQGARIIAIDAANSEILCRPESFGQAFRYLRYEPTPRKNEFINSQELPDLNFTFHVGEDYMDLVDGLRAIDEAMIFLNLRHGDRLGHALALGIDAEKYYAMENYTIVMPKQLFLDNVVWIWYKLQEENIPVEGGLLHKLHECYCQLFRDIYLENYDLNEQIPTIQTYYQAWLLRGDNPSYYSIQTYDEGKNYSVEHNEKDYTLWQKHALNNLESVQLARQNKFARKLFYRYHFDENVKRQGELCYQFKIDNTYVKAVSFLQHKMRKNIEKQHICIETNPSSNYVIGTIDRYSNHPIFKFYNLGIDVEHPNCQIGVSINTDDQGVFSTSIEREFSLVALGLEKKFEKQEDTINTPRAIYRWLDDIREMAFEQRFKK